MMLETLFEKFDLFADAPDAVAKMRELILRLAMQGKLVSPNPRDEPADNLVGELKAEIADKNGRRTVPLPLIAPDEIPFELPAGWVWERLGNIGETNIGLTYSPQDVSGAGTPVLRSSNIQNGKLDFDDLVRVTCEPKQSVMVQNGDLLICARNGSRALVGKVALIEDLKEPAAFGAFMAIFRSRVNRFLYHFICSPLFRRMIDEVGTTTINQITQNNLRSTLAPIPPLGEQKRIVAKVEELMALCDRLEVQQQERETRHAALARASLVRFAEAPNSANLDFLFHKSYAITPADLRKSILTLAVQGKLVPQNSNDKPVDDILTKKSALDSSSLAELPSNWGWRRVDEVGGVDLGRQRAPQHHRGPHMRPYLRVQNVYEDRIDTSDVKEMNFTPAEFETFALCDGDLLLNEGQSRELVGRPAIYRGEVPGACFQNTLVRFRHYACAMPEYALVVFRSYMRNGRFREISKQTTNIAHLSAGRFSALEFPLPPLAEQRRIVAKVNQLMALVDTLEAQLAASRATAAKLLDALVAELTKPQERPAPTRPVIDSRKYLVQFVAALLENVRRPIYIHELTRAVAFLFLPNRLLSLAESVGGESARRHFENFAQANTDGILSDALKVLHRAGAISYVLNGLEYIVKIHPAKAPPVDPIIEQDGKYMADILELLPAEESNPAMEAQVQQLEEELFPAM